MANTRQKTTPIAQFSFIFIAAIINAGCATMDGMMQQAKESMQPYLGSTQTSPVSASDEKSQKVTINGKLPPASELERLEKQYGQKLPSGDYWHDARSGLGGKIGGPAEVYVPGYDFGAVPKDASRGQSGIIVNGRELNDTEAQMLGSLFTIGQGDLAKYRGSYRLDTRGNFYKERDGALLGNLVELAKKKNKLSNRSDNFWHSKGGATGNSEGGCSYISIPSGVDTSSTSVTVGC